MKTDLIFPLPCTVCKLNICYNELPFCEKCINELQNILTAECRKCGKKPSACVCTENRDVRFAFFYKGRSARSIIYLIKDKADKRAMDFWAELAVRAGGINVKGFDAVAFVPRSKQNKNRFGFDQSELLAKSVSKLYGIPVIYALERIGGKEQKLLSRGERYKNMLGRFRIRKDYKTDKIYNKILLVDDVCTTGATVKACAAILRGTVSRSVVPLVLAKTD